MTAAMVEIPTLAARLRAVVALAGLYPLLAGVDLDVGPRQILVVKGANGAGKTSLLRVMAGLVPIAAGEATVLGLEPTSQARELRRQVGLLGHRNGLYDDLSAEENVRFCVRAARLPKESAPLALDRLGVTSRLRRLPVGKLSAGQRRRVALACLVARQPRLWLLDEPHAGLDAENRQLLDNLLRETVGAGATVVLATHEASVTGALADRVVTMSGGTVLDGVSALDGAREEVTSVA
ncbi:MAG: heme ABC exporter ATP-binding protein CcmA [Acidimicrobiales bacterium]